MAEAAKPVLFICYSHTDQKYRERFTKFLDSPALQNMTIFHDAKIQPGEDWLQRILGSLQKATAALVLVSQDFMISPFIQQVELREILTNHVRRGLRLFLVPVRSTLYQGTYLERLEWARPPDKPLALLSEAEQENAMVENLPQDRHPGDQSGRSDDREHHRVPGEYAEVGPSVSLRAEGARR